jgi:hypothetical protein
LRPWAARLVGRPRATRGLCRDIAGRQGGSIRTETIDRDRNTLYEGDVVEDVAGLLWLVRNDGLKRRGDWLPIEKASEMRVVNSEPGLSREQLADLGLEP